MKTTLDLSDALFVAAKKRAAETRRPLRAIVEDGLRAVLGSPAGSRRRSRRPIRWVTCPGGLPPGLDIADRTSMHEFMRRDRERRT